MAAYDDTGNARAEERVVLARSRSNLRRSVSAGWWD